MNRAEKELARLRAARNAARADLSQRVADVRQLAKPGELSKRVIAEVHPRARDAAWQVIEIASDNRGLIAATVSAVLLWAGRKQLLGGLGFLRRRTQADARLAEALAAGKAHASALAGRWCPRKRPSPEDLSEK